MLVQDLISELDVAPILDPHVRDERNPPSRRLPNGLILLLSLFPPFLHYNL